MGKKRTDKYLKLNKISKDRGDIYSNKLLLTSVNLR